MKKLIFIIFLQMTLIQFSFSSDSILSAVSGPEKVPLIELYSSEGCSSTPPADQIFTSLKNRGDLWKKFVPIKFQVDYWNYLGWVDPLSQAQFSQRQRSHAKRSASKRVYTPEFFVNGIETQAHKILNKDTDKKTDDPGILTLTFDSNKNIKLNFEAPQNKTKKPYRLNIALLQMGLTRKITKGENAHKTLNHDFIVIQLKNEIVQNNNGEFLTHFENLSKTENHNYALIGWVEDINTNTPIQAVGMDLK